MHPLWLFVCALLFIYILYTSAEKRRFLEAFAADKTTRWNIETRGGKMTLSTKVDELDLQLVADKRLLQRLWTVSVCKLRLAGSTTLEIYPQGVLGAAGNVLGWQDVVIGQPDFDRRFTVRGSDPGVIRAVLGSSRTLRAVSALFEEAVDTCLLDADGTLLVRARRQQLTADEARRVLGLVSNLARQLEAGADKAGKRGRPPQADLDPSVPSSGGVDGSPVAIKVR